MTRIKLLIVFILLLGFWKNSSAFTAGVPANANEAISSTTFPSDTVNLTVRMLDSIELCYFSTDPLNFGNYQFIVLAGDDSTLLGKTINVYLGSYDFFEYDSPLAYGWSGNIRIIKRWANYAPYEFFQLDYIYSPGEVFINSHKSLNIGSI